MTATPPSERVAPVTPASVCLPAGSFMIEDADEEVFLLFTGKQQSKQPDDGLGFAVQTKSSDTIPISITVQEREWEGNELGSVGMGRGGVKAKRRRARKEVTFDLELHQDLDALRNRAGDTGSVLWRVSLHLANFFLAQHHFPPPTPLFPHWSASTVLELGSGTGCLGLLIGKTVAAWTFSDQLSSLDLILKNRKRNQVPGAPPLGEVREVDWVLEAADAAKRSGVRNDDVAPDLIVAADCIFNPFLSAPLARTIDALAGPNTVALVASELRDHEPLELFLREWLDLDWKVARMVFGPEDGEGLGRRSFVVWIGWREPFDRPPNAK